MEAGGQALMWGKETTDGVVRALCLLVVHSLLSHRSTGSECYRLIVRWWWGGFEWYLVEVICLFAFWTVPLPQGRRAIDLDCRWRIAVEATDYLLLQATTEHPLQMQTVVEDFGRVCRTE